MVRAQENGHEIKAAAWLTAYADFIDAREAELGHQLTDDEFHIASHEYRGTKCIYDIIDGLDIAEGVTSITIPRAKRETK